jgi:glutamine amidotransferase
VAILDCELGNLFSVLHACQSLGADARLIHRPEELADSDAVILPGVGAFGDAMAALSARGLDVALREFARSGRPLLGICLGFQLLFSRGEEFGEHRGLDLLPGDVVRLPGTAPRAARLRVPQIGWNRILPPGGDPGAWTGTLLAGTRSGDWMWFVHSYIVRPSDPASCLCQTDYEGIVFCSGARRDNVVGLQFHPEKSGTPGLRALGSWLRGGGDGA